MATWGNKDTVVYLVAELISDPAQRVIVKTTEDRIGAKRRAMQADIRDQKFPRWTPFAGAVINQDYTIRLFNQDMTPYN